MRHNIRNDTFTNIALIYSGIILDKCATFATQFNNQRYMAAAMLAAAIHAASVLNDNSADLF